MCGERTVNLVRVIYLCYNIVRYFREINCLLATCFGEGIDYEQALDEEFYNYNSRHSDI